MIHLVYPLHPRYNPEAANHHSPHTRDCPPQPPCNPALRKRGQQIWYFPNFHWFLFVLNTPLQLGSWLQSNQDFTEHMLSVTISKSRLYLLYFQKEFFIVYVNKKLGWCEQCSLTVQNLTVAVPTLDWIQCLSSSIEVDYSPVFAVPPPFCMEASNPEASLIVLDFTISVYSSSCNYLFVGLLLS